MSPNTVELQEGAVLLGDAHYSARRPEFLEFLKAIERGDLNTPQLILMGDIFDLLFGDIAITAERNAEAVALINTLSERLELLYLEGNHDFRLASLFPKVKVLPIQQQPLACTYGDKRLMLAHGDFGMGWKYTLYTFLIRSRPVLAFLRLLDSFSSHAVIRWLDSYLEKKNDCIEIEDFKGYIQRHLSGYDLGEYDYFIEGHYHQNSRFYTGNCRYINLAAFACNQRYFIVQSRDKPELLEEIIFARSRDA